MRPVDKKALDDIKQYGCHVIHVLEGDLPPFSYSVGIQKSSNRPEVVVIGLKQPIAHFIVNEYNILIRSGERFTVGQRYDGFLEGFQIQIGDVYKKHYAEYFGWNRRLYQGDEFSVVQIIYPNTEGIWPWDKTADQWFRNRQPLLGRKRSRSVR